MTFNEWWQTEGRGACLSFAFSDNFERMVAEAAWYAAVRNQNTHWLPIESAPWDVEVQICYTCPENGPRVAIAKHDMEWGWQINSGWTTIGVKGTVTHWRLPPPTPQEAQDE